MGVSVPRFVQLQPNALVQCALPNLAQMSLFASYINTCNAFGYQGFWFFSDGIWLAVVKTLGQFFTHILHLV